MLGSSPDEPKLFGLAHNDAVTNMSREGQRQERAGQRPYNASRAGPADDLLPGEAQQKPASAAAPDHAKSQVRGPLRPEHICAPSRIRTCDLLLIRKSVS